MVYAISITAARMGAGITGRGPGAGVMAGTARSPREQSRMERRICMAGRTRGGLAGESTIGMTAITTQTGMRPGQWKDNVVIETGRSPAIGRMASAAGSSEFSGMGVIFGMAGITTGWCAFKYIFDVTVDARH
jgi:hypothetical protein